MRAQFSVFVVSIVFICTISLGVRTFAKQNSEACQRTLPANIELPRDLERLLAKIHRGSATFREQCERIAAADTLDVVVRLDTAIPHSCQAFTLFRRKGRVLSAEVHLPPAGTKMAELVGHEFEHIIEQLDGLNLRVLARIRDSGVHESSFDVFESARAQHAGRVVASETYAPQQAAD
jgi:hypothetical protein